MVQRAIANGHMKDEVDLTEKYGNKPEQLAAIFANANSFTCQIRNCKLWADPDFVTEWDFEQSKEKDETLTFATDDAERAAKKQKTEQTEKAPPTEGEAKALKSADLEKLKELLATIMEEVNKYDESVTKATQEEFKEYIPQKCILKMMQTKNRNLRKSGRALMYTWRWQEQVYVQTYPSAVAGYQESTKEEHEDVKGRVTTAENDMKA